MQHYNTEGNSLQLQECLTLQIRIPTIAKQRIEKDARMLKANSPRIKSVISKMQEINIDFIVNPSFKY